MQVHRPTRRHQGGYLVFEAMLALLVTSLAAVVTHRALLRSNAVAFATIQADLLDTARRALNFYIFDNYPALQDDLDIRKGMLVVPHGTGPGETRRPRAADLRSLGYLPAAFSDTAVLNGGRYQFELVKNPPGCSGSPCEINGAVWIDRPLVQPGAAADPDGLSVGTILLRLGGNGAASLLTAPGVLTGSGGGFSLPNPVAGSPAGVVGARVGFHAQVEAAYVRQRDDRDPGLRGPLTVAGPTVLQSTLTAGTTTVGGDLSVAGAIGARDGVAAGQGAPGCARSILGSDGRIVVRRADCTDAIQIDGSTAQVRALDAGGRPRIVLDGQAGDLRFLDPAAPGGSPTARIEGGTGRAVLASAQLTGSATAGTACPVEGEVVLDSDAAGATVACRAGLWRRSGLPPATVGAACTGGGLGQDGAGTALLCRGGQWVALTERITRSVLMARHLVQDGETVPHPSCPTGAAPAIVLTPVETATDQTGEPARNRFAAFAVDASGQWLARIRLYDAGGGAGHATSFSGQAYGLRAIAQTFCDYPT